MAPTAEDPPPPHWPEGIPRMILNLPGGPVDITSPTPMGHLAGGVSEAMSALVSDMERRRRDAYEQGYAEGVRVERERWRIRVRASEVSPAGPSDREVQAASAKLPYPWQPADPASEASPPTTPAAAPTASSSSSGHGAAAVDLIYEAASPSLEDEVKKVSDALQVSMEELILSGPLPPTISRRDTPEEKGRAREAGLGREGDTPARG